MKGRKKLESSYEQNELNKKIIALILQDVLKIHNLNAIDIRYLREQYRGDQEIYKKIKDVRSNINNMVSENHLRHALSFKKSYVFGDQVQYVSKTHEADVIQSKDGIEEEIATELSIFNVQMANASKGTLDLDLAEEIYVSGVCPRILQAKGDGFELFNLNPENSAVVYSTGIGSKRLFSFYTTRKKDLETDKENLHITVHTEKNKYIYTTPYENYINGMKDVPDGSELGVEKEVNLLGHIPIFEYTFNKDRVSIVEIMLPAQNTLNLITSSELDDIEQFVEQLLVFTNAEIDADKAAELRELGIINLKDTSAFKASVQILAAKMDNMGINTLYERIYEIMMINGGVPLVNGDSGGGDTGLARLTNNGWLMADTKAKEDELSFIESEKPLLEALIDLLKKKSKLKHLEISNIDTKFTRNKSDNIITKIQSIQSGIGILHLKDLIVLSGISNDPEQLFRNAVDFYGIDHFKQRQESDPNLNNDVVETIATEPKE